MSSYNSLLLALLSRRQFRSHFLAGNCQYKDVCHICLYAIEAYTFQPLVCTEEGSFHADERPKCRVTIRKNWSCGHYVYGGVFDGGMRHTSSRMVFRSNSCSTLYINITDGTDRLYRRDVAPTRSIITISVALRIHACVSGNLATIRKF